MHCRRRFPRANQPDLFSSPPALQLAVPTSRFKQQIRQLLAKMLWSNSIRPEARTTDGGGR